MIVSFLQDDAYVRYVDDILTVFKTRGHINHFINRLQAGSVLKFTYEPMVDNGFNLLDVGILVNGDGFIKTSVFIKPTDHGTYTNFYSHTPDAYKSQL